MFRKKKKNSKGSTSDTLKSLRKTINGYVDYEDKASRNQTDPIIRRYLVDRLIESQDNFSKVHGQLMQAQILSAWQASNQIMAMITDLRQFLTKDVYKHSTFFEAKDVSQILEVSVFYILESEVIITIQGMNELIIKISQDLNNVNMTDVETNILKVKKFIFEVYQAIKDRAELITAFELVGF